MFDEVYCAGRDTNGSDGDAVDYFALTQHPVAKVIYDSFNPHAKHADATLAQREHFDGIFPSIELCLFFKNAPTTYNNYYTQIYHNIRSYTLYRLSKDQKITLTAFNSTAALSTLKIDINKEVLTPAVGSFVITFKDSNNQTQDIVIHIEKCNNSMEWTIYAASSVAYSSFDKMFRESIKTHNYYQGKVFDRGGNFLALPETSFDDIYLSDSIRTEVKKNIIDYVESEAVKNKIKNGIPTTRGVIFEGAPGVGKTYLSRVLANHLDTTFIVIDDLERIEEIVQIFDFAKQFPQVILLFEDIDVYIKDREYGGNLLSTLLNKLDGIESNNLMVVICTTNDVETLDKAIQNRPGRFDRILKFDKPDSKLKEAMLKGFCKGKNLEDDIDFEAIAICIPDGFTGAHVKEIYITACNEAIDNNEVDGSGLVILSTKRFISSINMVKNRTEIKRIGFSK